MKNARLVPVQSAKVPTPFNDLARRIYAWAEEKGFWENDHESAKVGEKIALMHAELSELLEAYRANAYAPSLKDERMSYAEEEIADLIIRALDFAAWEDMDVDKAIRLKMEYNMTRPYKHGKKF